MPNVFPAWPQFKLIALQGSLFFKQEIRESEKLVTFSRSGVEKNQDKIPCLFVCVLLSLYTMRPLEANLSRIFLENKCTVWPPGSMKETPHLHLPLLKAEKVGVTGLACGHRTGASLGIWHKCIPSFPEWTKQGRKRNELLWARVGGSRGSPVSTSG
jgi:hypothetical protein